MGSARVLVIQLDHSDPPGRLDDWLRSAGLDVDLCNLAAGETVPVEPEPGGVVVLGGTMSFSDDAAFPFLAEVRELLRSVIRDEVPTLAICLGAQLLAAANGGRVEPNPGGPELGAQLIAKRGIASNDPLFGPIPITPDVIQWHYDAITVLPPGALQLASSPTCEHQAFRLGRLAWGIQFHIETTPEVVQGWAQADATELRDLDLDVIVSRAAAVHADIEEVWTPFVHAFADIVRDPSAVRAPRGVPTSSAAPVTDAAAIRAALAAEAGESRAGLPMPTLRPADG